MGILSVGYDKPLIDTAPCVSLVRPGGRKANRSVSGFVIPGRANHTQGVGILREFSSSDEAAFRRRVRSLVRSGPFTKSEREVILAFVNHWFALRVANHGVVYPGRKKLAKRAKVSVATVKRTLSLLRTYKAIAPTAHLNGLSGKATEYVVNIPALAFLCGLESLPKRNNGGSNDPTPGRVKMTHRSYDGDNLIQVDFSKGPNHA